MKQTSKDLSGEQFGRWTVVRQAESQYNKKGYKERQWYCRCVCGTERVVAERRLLSGGSLSCGCSRKLDLTNQKYGRLLVIRETDSRVSSNGKTTRIWECKCDCGNLVNVTQNNLVRGATKSCGCLHKDSMKQIRKYTDISGNKYGSWTALYEINPIYNANGYPIRRYMCQCDCGTTKPVELGKLVTGQTLSCGCVPLSKIIKYNTFELYDNYGIGYTTKGESFYFSVEDYDLIKDYCWDINNGYVIALKKKTKRRILLHRLIMGVIDDPSVLVDHIDHNPSNNRRNNLRIATYSQNLVNVGLRKDNTSGYTGVQQDKRNNKWTARISVNKRSVWLGSYANIEDAIAARKAAEEKYFGEYSFDNSQQIAELNKINA